MIVIDESTSYLNDPSRYGRAMNGQRVQGYNPASERRSVSLIGAIGLGQITGFLYGLWTTTGEIFKTFLAEQVVPKLKKGMYVVMDNAKIHKVSGVKELIESAGAKVVYLPPYSPDLSPIEPMWSKIKNSLRKKVTTELGKYHEALLQSLNEINEEDFFGWFDNCGYRVNN